MSRRHYRYGAWFLCALLAACSSNPEAMREDLGLTRKAPDEYRVYARPPLNVPPEFNLRPPATGTSSALAAGADAQAQAHNRILGDEPAASAAAASPAPQHILAGSASSAAAVGRVSTSDLPSSADAQFLSDAGAAHADSHIRDIINQENTGVAAHKSSTYLFDGKKNTDSVVDAQGERQRLQQDKAQSQPPTTGDTPVVAPKDKGILGDIF